MKNYKKAEQPNQIADIVGEYLKAGDLDGVVTMFHPGCQIYFPPDAPPLIGKEGARQAFAEFAKIRPTLKSTVNHQAINGDTALLSATWELQGPDGSIIGAGTSTEVTKQLDDGSWVYFIDCPLSIPAL